MLLAPEPEGMPAAGWRTAALAGLMAIWWVSEAVPIGATALLPVILLPVLQVRPVEDAAAPYANPVIALFLGGFMLAEAIQRCDLHRRLALQALVIVGTRPDRIVAGFMGVAALLSMWISNTATAVILFPLASSVIAAMGAAEGASGSTARDFSAALLLGVTYACSIGGMATLIGSPPNALLAGFMAEHHARSIGFVDWMAMAMPVVVAGLPISWWLLTHWLHPLGRASHAGLDAGFRAERAQLGSLSGAQRVTGGVLLVTIGAWLSRPLWEQWVPGLTDSGVALIAALSLFLVPLEPGRGRFVLDRAALRSIPWEVLILVGGGLSLAGAIGGSGLAEWIGGQATALRELPLGFTILVVSGITVLVTEGMSNTAAVAASLPVLSALADEVGQPPMRLLVPATLAASCAFMMPVATPPNAIAVGTGHVTVRQMVRAGAALNVLFTGLITLSALLFLPSPE